LTLDQLPIDETGVVREVGGSGGFRRRLLELGLVPGTPVLRTGQAPLGDPLTFRVRGALLSIRRDDARAVAVEAL
jgi:Fe2+ transport system protein FeoA